VLHSLLLLSLYIAIMLSGSVLYADNLKGFELVEKIVREDSPKTVEQFLGILKQQQPELFSRFTLMRESKSLQSASPANPRAIVFGLDAKFVISFNGSPDQNGFYQIEMIQFVDSAPLGARFEMREINFDPQGTDVAQLSEINPSKCARCHGSDPKPIWESYDNWPGAYGEEDDALIDFDDGDRFPPTGHNDNSIVKRHRQHLKEFRSFMAVKDQHSRFQLLEFPKGTDSPVAPYIPRIRSGSDPLRPNLQLTKHFSELNGLKLARQMNTARGESCAALTTPLIAASLIGCDGVDAVSSKMKDWKTALIKIKDASDLKLPLPRWDSRDRQDASFDIMQLATFSGVSDFDWSPARIRLQWKYFQGFKDIGDDIVAGLWPGLKGKLTNLPEYGQIRAQLYPTYYRAEYSDNTYSNTYGDEGAEYEGSNGYREYPSPREIACRELISAVDQIDLIAKIETSCLPKARPEAEIPSAVKICMSCHNGSGGPKLDLEHSDLRQINPELFQNIQRRLVSAEENSRMPLGRSLSISEFETLLNFWK
jgi:hypothetical protein